MFEAEVTEVKDGIVEIKSIAREAGSRTKIAVWSNDPDVDPVGACVGMNGVRVNAIVNELRGEKIDIINWNENPAMLIENALSPAREAGDFMDYENDYEDEDYDDEYYDDEYYDEEYEEAEFEEENALEEGTDAVIEEELEEEKGGEYNE